MKQNYIYSFFSNIKVQAWAMSLTALIFLGSIVSFSELHAQSTSGADTASVTLKKVLQKNSYPIFVKKGELKGRGGALLLKRAKEATIVTIGESHATQQIPLMITSLINELQQANELDHLAIEVSPWTARQMSDSLRSGVGAYNRLIAQYPTAIPFYNFKAERNLVRQAVRGSGADNPLWGLDQIFAFSTEMALDRLQELAPSPEARAVINDVRKAGLKRTAEDPRLQSLPSSIPPPISVYAASTFDSLSTYFPDSSEGQQVLNELSASISMYRTNGQNNYLSNQLRARYLRDNFRQAVRQTQVRSQEKPQIVVKLGARHAYRGMTPNNALDVGNLSISLARAIGGSALNVAILCGPGSKNTRFPAQTGKCHNSYLNEDIRSLINDRGVYLDLSAIQPLMHEGMLEVNDALEEFFWGFDAAIYIPDTTPAEPIISP